MKWSEGEIESFKSALRSHGKNWSAIAEGMTASASEKATPVGPKGKHNSAAASSDKCKKSAEQCKSFFFTHRKQQQLDKILIERKRVRVCSAPQTNKCGLKSLSVRVHISALRKSVVLL